MSAHPLAASWAWAVHNASRPIIVSLWTGEKRECKFISTTTESQVLKLRTSLNVTSDDLINVYGFSCGQKCLRNIFYSFNTYLLSSYYVKALWIAMVGGIGIITGKREDSSIDQYPFIVLCGNRLDHLLIFIFFSFRCRI